MELDVWVEFDSNEMDNWKGGEWSKTMDGNYHKGRTPHFPCGHDYFYKVRDLADSGKYETAYIDNLTRYVMVPKSIILNLLDSNKSMLDHIKERTAELKVFIESLPDDKNYKLISDEF